MPGSYPTFKREVAAHIHGRMAGCGRVLDVGPGMGTWAELLGHWRLDAVEVFEPYVERFALRNKYRRVIVADVRDVDLSDWCYVIVGDVLEHLPVGDAQRLIREATAAGIDMMVALPYLCPQDDVGGNEAERHLQPDLTPEVIAERYPELRLLIGDEVYGYFVNYDTPPLQPDGLPDWEMPLQIHVLWVNGARGYWDHGLLIEAFAGRLWPTPNRFAYVEREKADDVGGAGCIAIVAGRWAASDPAPLTAFVAGRAWTLAMVVSDEEGAFPLEALRHQNSLVCVQTPRPDAPDWLRRKIPLGWRTDTRLTVLNPSPIPMPPAHRPLLWSFAGQVRDNPKRRECVRELEKLSHDIPGEMTVTGGFGEGLPYRAYLERLARTALVPSPSGPATPDCFRTWEALEMGCLPVVDKHSPLHRYEGIGGYYDAVGGMSAPHVEGWESFGQIARRYAERPDELTRDMNTAYAWWQWRKRQFVLDMEADIHAVSGLRPDRATTLRAKITVLVSTSPVPGNPDTAMIEATIARVRAYPELRDCEVLVMVDGVRAEQEHRRADYQEFTRRLLWRCNWQPELFGVLPILFDDHQHQANTARRALDMVQTPLVLYVEHDTWPEGDIDWRGIARAVEDCAGGCRVMRLLHDEQVHPEHRHLLHGAERADMDGVPAYRTMQWSQRPHVARTTDYREWIAGRFAASSRTMIEDVMHGAVQSAPWEAHGVCIYAPPGGIKRSGTCDGRGADPKYEMRF